MVMASAGVNNLPAGGDGGDRSSSAALECRLRRRRRLRLRLAPPRASSATAAGSGGEDAPSGGGDGGKAPLSQLLPASSSSSLDQQDPPELDMEDEVVAGAEAEAGQEEAHDQQEQQAGGLQAPPLLPEVPADAAFAAAQAWPVAFGSIALTGRMREMEDTVSLHPAFCAWVDGEPMHFFAVFDGHGGPHVSALCRDQMHVILAEELTSASSALLHRRHQLASGAGTTEREAEELAWRAAFARAFARVDALAAAACACGRATSPRCRCPCPLSSHSSGIVGSTAIVAMLVRDRLVVANCGDSRAVLCRGAHAVPLSSDHKPDRPDERARVEAVGGCVLFVNGLRVRGILAMTRALGDRLLRPEVISEPEVTITARTEEDECLILASDGMWDSISNEIACDVARHCLEDGGGAGQEPGPLPSCFRAASLLSRLAIGRDSHDNVSVVVIDLKQRGG